MAIKHLEPIPSFVLVETLLQISSSLAILASLRSLLFLENHNLDGGEQALAGGVAFSCVSEVHQLKCMARDRVRLLE